MEGTTYIGRRKLAEDEVVIGVVHGFGYMIEYTIENTLWLGGLTKITTRQIGPLYTEGSVPTTLDVGEKPKRIGGLFNGVVVKRVAPKK